MRPVFQTDDGKIFDTAKEAIAWENGKQFTLRRLKREFSELSKEQYKDKRNRCLFGERIKRDIRMTESVEGLANLDSRIALRAQKLATIQRSWIAVKSS